MSVRRRATPRGGPSHVRSRTCGTPSGRRCAPPMRRDHYPPLQVVVIHLFERGVDNLPDGPAVDGVEFSPLASDGVMEERGPARLDARELLVTIGPRLQRCGDRSRHARLPTGMLRDGLVMPQSGYRFHPEHPAATSASRPGSTICNKKYICCYGDLAFFVPSLSGRAGCQVSESSCREGIENLPPPWRRLLQEQESPEPMTDPTQSPALAPARPPTHARVEEYPPVPLHPKRY